MLRVWRQTSGCHLCVCMHVWACECTRARCRAHLAAGLAVLELEVLVRELLAVDRLAAGAVAAREVSALEHEALRHHMRERARERMASCAIPSRRSLLSFAPVRACFCLGALRHEPR